jgi:hypothetical protein
VQPDNSDHNKWPRTVVVETAGEILEDGTLVELIQHPQEPNRLGLLKADGTGAVLLSRVEHKDRIFVPLVVDRTVRSELSLASQLAPYGSIQTLSEELLAMIARYTDLAEHVRQQLVAVIFASWVVDFLPSPVNIWLWSPSIPDGARVLQLLRSTCRISLPISGANAADLRRLTSQLPATLLLLLPASGQRTREWLAASSWPDFPQARSGRLVRTVGAKVIVSDAPVGRFNGSFVEIPVVPNTRPLPPLDAKARREIAQEFLPKLLQFRVDCWRGRFAEDADVDGPADGTASALRSSIVDSPQLKQHLALLMEAEPELSDRRLGDSRVVLLQSLLLRCHEPGRDELHVAEIAADVNTILDDQGAISPLSPRLVGGLLKDVGLFTHRLGKNGRGLRLDLATRRMIHRLADTHNVPSANQPFTGCNECADSQVIDE